MTTQSANPPPSPPKPRPVLRERRASLERDLHWLDKAGTLLLLVLGCAMLAFYLVVTYRGMMHSDAAMKLLLGEQMAQQLSLFPRDWNYVNDICILFPSLIAAPLLLFFPPSMTMHALVDLIAAGLVLWAAYLAARAVGVNGALRWLPATLLASGFSGEFAEVVFGQSGYSCVIFILALLCGSSARYLGAAEDSRLRKRDLCIVFALIAISVASGPRGIASYAAPFLLAVASIHLLSAHSPGLQIATRRLFAFGLLATLAGAACFMVLIRITLYHSGALAQGFAPHDQIARHLQLIISNWFSLFDALPPNGGRFSVVVAAIYAARMALSAVVFLLPLCLLLRIRACRSTALQFLLAFHTAVVISTLYLLIFTGVFVDAERGAPRYLIPIIPSALLILTLWLQETGANLRFNAVRAGWLASLTMLSLSPLQLVAPAFAHWPHIDASLRANRHAGLVQTLEQAGLHRGFATYWHANVVSILSSGSVRIAPVTIDDGSLPKPFRHLTSNRWYESTQNEMPTFLLLDPVEKKSLNRVAFDDILGQPERTLQSGEFEILVYPFDIGKKLGFATQAFVHLPRMTPETCAADFRLEPQEISLRPAEPGVAHIHATNRSAITWSQNSMPNFNPAVRINNASGVQVSETRGLLPGAVPPRRHYGSARALPCTRNTRTLHAIFQFCRRRRCVVWWAGFELGNSSACRSTMREQTVRWLQHHSFILLCIAFTVTSQLLMRWRVGLAGTLPEATGERVQFIAHLLLSPWIWLAVACTFLAGVSWMLALTRFELSYAFPFTGASFLLILFCGAVLFNEHVSVVRIIGTAVVMLGLFIVVRS